MASYSGSPYNYPSSPTLLNSSFASCWSTELGATTKLSFSIHKYSSYSSAYYPENILQDRPKDQTSRWSSDSNTPPQFLILKLQQPAIVETITFGKYEKTHVCNLKRFKIFGGLSEDNLIELLESGLKNDSLSETFPLKHEIEGYSFPCRFIKIVPLQSWGPSFNFSIWFVELVGIDDGEIVGPAITRFNTYREREAIRVCLKHLRDHNYLEAVELLQKKTRVQLEASIMTEFHRTLVLEGDYDAAEIFLDGSDALFHDYVARQDYKAIWSPIPPEGGQDFYGATGDQLPRPGMRGGHQMIMDPHGQTIYLFGGWDGNVDLADFWSFHLPSTKWRLLCHNTELYGGPSPRSCHKMCLDPIRRKIFTLGRYLDSGSRPSRALLKSDFYMYDIDTKEWTLIVDDTSTVGGPQLVFDHQMCMDVKNETIYVFGGRILTNTNTVTETLSNIVIVPGLEEDPDSPRQRLEEERGRGQLRRLMQGNIRYFPPNPNESPLLAGRRGGDENESPTVSSPSSANSELHYSGLYAYHVPSNTWTQLRPDFSKASSKPSIRSRVGHSMLFHPELRKLYIFAGQRCKEYLNDFFSYDVDKDEIEMITNGCTSKRNSGIFPSAGFTQRATIDPELHEIYIFSGLSKDKEKRDEAVQNSFWVFDILRKTWSCVYRNGNGSDGQASGNEGWALTGSEPCPRFAHQLVYDHVGKVHYLFGGNPGRSKDPKLRLDDFWSLRLSRPSKEHLLRQCKLLLRRRRFEELAVLDPLNALCYLQTSLFELIDHFDPQQEKEFQRLPLLLFPTEEDDEGFGREADELVLRRSQLFDKLVTFFPEQMTQPRVNLIDLLPI